MEKISIRKEKIDVGSKEEPKPMDMIILGKMVRKSLKLENGSTVYNALIMKELWLTNDDFAVMKEKINKL